MDSNDIIYNDSIKMHVHNIRNMNILTNSMLQNISILSKHDMMQIILVYNDTMKAYKEFIEKILEN